MDTEHCKKIETPADVAMGPDGQPGWIVLKTRFKNKYALAFSQVNRLSGLAGMAIETMKADPNDKSIEAEAMELVRHLNEANDNAWETYAALVLDWNWQDEESGQPLPKPAGNVGVFKTELYPQQQAWIREQIDSVQQYRATEGNALSGSDSQPG